MWPYVWVISPPHLCYNNYPQTEVIKLSIAICLPQIGATTSLPHLRLVRVCHGLFDYDWRHEDTNNDDDGADAADDDGNDDDDASSMLKMTTTLPPTML